MSVWENDSLERPMRMIAWTDRYDHDSVVLNILRYLNLLFQVISKLNILSTPFRAEQTFRQSFISSCWTQIILSNFKNLYS